MMRYKNIYKHVAKNLIAITSGLLGVAITHNAYAGLPDQRPLFLVAPVAPILMLSMPKEQQLFTKLYNDYSDLSRVGGTTPDGKVDIADTTYNPVYEYYGYFDSKKCYTYVSGKSRFEPSTAPAAALPNCTGTDDWSGNFLNWAAMTRIDAIRKILYGGYRVVDSASTSSTVFGETVLERALLPNDAHSFAKYYAPVVGGAVSVDEMRKVVPDTLADAAGVTFCNTTDTDKRSNNSDTLSQNVTNPPLLKAAKGNYSLWAANERWQCGWKNDPDGNADLKNATNSNDKNVSLIDAKSDNPSRDDASGYGNYVVRVQVCKSGFISLTNDNEKCKSYENLSSSDIKTLKPTGLLHAYGENDSIYFGLVTGSYSKNKSGGVLRKAASSFKDEVSAGSGVFLKPTNSIVKTLDKLRIYGYRFDDGTYFNGPTGNDNCSWGLNTFGDGSCTNWGNPQAEIYLETLRYLAGKSAPTADFAVAGDDKLSGLTSINVSTTSGKGIDWKDPITNTKDGNYCTPLNVMQFNASMSSYDADNLGAAPSTIRTDTDPVAPSLASAVDLIAGASFENLIGSYYVGATAGTNDGLCTAKTLDVGGNKLSTVRGICPEAPRLEGSYYIGGLAYLARKYGVGTESSYKRQPVKTFGVALATALPRVDVLVPGTTDQKVTIIPACRNLSINGNCAIVDFKVLPEVTSNGVTTGQLYVNWEDSEQGGDFDQDMWGVIRYSVSSTNLTVTTRVVAQSTPNQMGFGYVLGGTDNDGFKVDSGINNFTLGNCVSCTVGGTPAAKIYNIPAPVDSAQGKLQLPLYYAAKWGGWSYKRDPSSKAYIKLTDAEINALDPTNRSQKGNYYYATEPKELETGLSNALSQVVGSAGSASTVTANSTSIGTETSIYQARFDSASWTGNLVAYKLENAGVGAKKWDTDDTLTRPAILDDGSSTPSNSIPSYRKVYTANNTLTAPSGAAVLLSDIDSADIADLKAKLKLSTEPDYAMAGKRFNWLLGSAYYEKTLELRARARLMGDVINSDPAYVGGTSFRYDMLPADTGLPTGGAYGASSYSAYVAQKAARTKAVFVGANDGMLHAFNADNGNELFAYIPRGVYASRVGGGSKLTDLSSPNYTHSYSVDGPVYASDVYITVPGGSAKEWRTVVTGTLGNGGPGVYALDVTDVLAGVTGAVPRVIFDIRADELGTATVPNSTLKNDLGYSQSKVLVLPTSAGRWVAIWGNGSNSGGGFAKLLAIDIETPTSVKVINTQVGSGSGLDNGLSGIAFMPSGTGSLAYAYAGDIAGNMWKFDLRDTSMSSWDIPYSASSNPAPLIKVIDSTGTAQPITSTPTLGTNPIKLVSGSPSTMVYFGTGKYSESTDNSNKQVQSIYGIADTGSKISLTVANRATILHQKSIATQNATDRTLSNDANNSVTGAPAVTWTGSGAKDGWFLDLFFGASSADATGERVLSKPLLLFDRVIINTFVASANPCDFGGSGWLMELVGVGNVFKGHSVLGVNANHVLDRPIIGDLSAISAGEKGVILGSELGDNVTDGGITVKQQTAAAGSAGRMSWRQLK